MTTHLPLPTPESPEANSSARSTGEWLVWRQDETGNRFLVQSKLSQEAANQLVAQFESHSHKQIYWIEPVTNEASPPIFPIEIDPSQVGPSSGSRPQDNLLPRNLAAPNSETPFPG